MATVSDAFYDRAGEFVGVLLPAVWQGMDAALTGALSGLDAGDDPIVDVGAGTGIGTAVIAAAVPGAEIIAVEPHRGLRTALLARIGGDDALRERVTVLDADLLAAPLPERISALVAMNVIGHFPPPDRRNVWALLAQRLTPQGRAVLNLYPPAGPQHVPATAMADVRIGRLRYTGTAAAEPAGDDAITWTMTYRVVDDGHTHTEFSATDHWYVFGPEQLAAELAEYDLHVTPGNPAHGIQVITR